MRERKGQLGEATLKHIAAERGMELIEVQNMVLAWGIGLSKAEIFRRLSSGCGTPNTHDSGKHEGEIRETGKYHSRKRFTRRRH